MAATKEKREPKTNQETWADLLDDMSIPVPPRDARISRSDLLSQLHPPGPHMPSMSEAALIDWEQRGFLPRAVVQLHQGKVQATYPAWWPGLVSTAWWLTRVGGYTREHAGRAVLSWINSTGRTREFTPLKGYLDAVRLAVNGLAHGYRQQQMTRSDHIKNARLTFVDTAGKEIFETEFALIGTDQDTILFDGTINANDSHHGGETTND